MQTNAAGTTLIKRFEGFSPTPYLCPGGVWTIGYGHTAGVNERTPRITQAEAEELLKRDVREAERIVSDYVRVPLHENQFAALVSFVFNIGKQHFVKSTLLQRLNDGDYLDAAGEMLRWVYASGRELEGLKTRRAAERTLFLELE